MATIADHQLHPEITLDEHVRRAQIAFGETLSKRRAIYLDMNYWINLRSAAKCDSKESKYVDLLNMLREGVAAGAIFCPISENVLIELMKQSDPASRLSTAALIDELSLGATLVDEPTRISTEIAHLFHSCVPHLKLHALEHLVWRKPSYVLGIMHPTNTMFDKETELAIQKALFDHMWSQPLCSMVKQIGDTPLPGSDRAVVAVNLNAEVAAHADSLRSFKQAYSAEVRGIVDLVGDIAVDVFESIARKSGQFEEKGVEDRHIKENMCKNLLAFALENGRGRKSLRTMHVLASLHASHRWNKGRQFNGNDLFDFSHAAAALAYCNGFFTEGPLRTMVTQKHVALDELYGCQVAVKVEDAIAYLRSLEETRS